MTDKTRYNFSEIRGDVEASDINKYIVAAHDQVTKLLAIPIPILSVLLVAFQNNQSDLSIGGTKFNSGQGALIALIVLCVVFYFCARNLFLMRDLLWVLHSDDLAGVRFTLQRSANLFNPFFHIHHKFTRRVTNYSDLVLMHIAPLGSVLGFGDLLIAKQRSFWFATDEMLLVIVFLIIYGVFYLSASAVMEIVNPSDWKLRRRVLGWAIILLSAGFLIYGWLANMSNVREAFEQMK